MSKRVIAVFFLFCLGFGSLVVRLYDIAVNIDAEKYTESHNKTVILDTLRQNIYDCNGISLVNKETENFIAAKPVLSSLSELRSVLDESSLKSAAATLSKGMPSYSSIENRQTAKTLNTVTLKKYVRYSDYQPAVHLIGKIDFDGKGETGIERSFDSFLKTDIPLSASFACDVNGRAIEGAPIKTDSRYNSSSGGVWLTIDRDIQQIAESELLNSSIKKGAVLICETTTGAIKAMASVPVYNPNNVAKSLNDKNAPLINRALTPYPVGSVFKVAVATAALQNGVSPGFLYDCKGSCLLDGQLFHCNNATAHGKINLEQALSCSCNCYFIELSKAIGAKAVYESATSFGFGFKAEIAENLYASSGKIPKIESLDMSGNLANFSFGQGTFSATSVQIANMFNAVGNGGKYVSPYVVTKAVSVDGKEKYNYRPKPPVYAMTEDTADTLCKMLKTVIKTGTAKNAATDGFDSAGKTATAQTGMFNADKSEKLCTWFGGFFPADNPKYTVVILNEDGTTGGADCAPVFKAIAEKIYNNY